MNNKQKVLEHLDEYRDITLTTGCRLMAGKVEWQFLRKEESALYEDYMLSLNAVGCAGSRNFHQTEIEEKFTILGHPATLATLLKGLGNIKGALTVDAKVDNNGWEQAYFSVVIEIDKDTCQSYGFFIPLVTNLQEIPAEDELWEALVNIFGL